MEEILQRLARIETKLDQSLATGVDHEKRIREVEHWKARVVGIYLAASVFGAAILTKVLSWVSISIAATRG